ncbi:MAG: radical SAM protein [Thermoanaerobaculia bacterium]
MRPVSNPPNPWQSVHAEYLGEPPEAGLEIYEEHARTIIAENESPDVGFRFSVNPYRGCFHACAYCLGGETPILMGDGRPRALADVRVGDEVYGTVLAGGYRRYVKTPVLHHWRRVENAFCVTLEDGTAIVASADHRFLTQRGWKHVSPGPRGERRSHLTRNNDLLGTGAFSKPPEDTSDYRKGYVCGVVRGDGLLASYAYHGRRRGVDTQHQFRLGLIDLEPLARVKRFLQDFAVQTRELLFQAAVSGRREMQAIRTCARAGVDEIRRLVEWPSEPGEDWRKGFLAGIFDAEGSYSRGILRISNTDPAIVERITASLRCFGFDFVVETRSLDRRKPIHDVRIRRGLREHLRFFHSVAPAITRKLDIAGQALKNDARLRVASVRPLGVALPLFDMTTGTGDFIANGVVSHNCYARPTHQYLGFGAGTDFDRKIVVKVNAPELLRRELSKPSWKGDTLVFSGVTDCYQPTEAVYALTRRCLEVCAEFRNPVGIVTKGALVRRDLDLLSAMARETEVVVYVSIPFADDRTGRAIEPNASLPSQRFDVLDALTAAGVRAGVAIAPVIPGLNDSDIPKILARARDAGAASAFLTLLRLPAETRIVFEERLPQAFPDRAARVFSNLEQARGGKRNESRFGARMEGVGPRWAAIESLFEVECRRLGFNAAPEERKPRTSRFRRPGPAQGSLFDLG